MGHAGALLGSPEENVPGKRAALERAGAHVVSDVLAVGEAVWRTMAASDRISPPVAHDCSEL
jgi:succinyl-CoA synthetase alpha subunit